MAEQKDVFLKRLLSTFRLEAEERLMAMSSLLLTLENSPNAETSRDLVETLFRDAHSLKGAARAVNLSPIESVCQALESALFELKGHHLPVSTHLFDTLHQVLDGLGVMLTEIGLVATPAHERRASELGALLAHGLAGHAASAVPPASAPRKGRRSAKVPVAEPKSSTSEPEPVAEIAVDVSERAAIPQVTTVRIPAERLDALLLQVEEVLLLKHSIGQRVRDLRAMGDELKERDKEWRKSYREARSGQRAMGPTGARNDIVTGSGSRLSWVDRAVDSLEERGLLMKSFDDRVALMSKALEQDHRILGTMVDHLLSNTKQLLMLPFASLLEMFPKLVRDLSRDKGREADLVIQGAEIVIDKRILEGLKDPLIHLVRNAIDHGIEDPDVRRAKGKPVRGVVSILVTHTNGSKVDILVSDDGAGVDEASVLSASVKMGVVARENANQLSQSEVVSLMFRSGVSTSPIITDLSGRGLGLAIVREKMEALGGTIAIETRPNAGTSFRLVLPLTLATVRGLLIRASGQVFMLPISNVIRVVRIDDKDIGTVENRETLEFAGEVLALVWLADVLQIPRGVLKGGGNPGLSAIVLGVGAERIAFRVDAVEDEQEILVKSLGAPLVRVRNVAGATVLGTGQVVPILNSLDLMKSALNVKGVLAVTPAADEAAGRLSILVAEDSITTRMLMKNILETAGYDVTTAVDGAEAFSLLKTEHFDLVVSDVEMPRMNGFDLTEKIRAASELADLPIVLVTALESREHRERGIDVGASAYIVKSSFDQSNLLEVIGRLI